MTRALMSLAKENDMELISREEVMRLAESGKLLSGSFGERAKDIIKAIPTIEERKEGEWLDNKWLGEKCSVCRWELHYINFNQFNYCPNCGAKMKGEK